uniref:Uncharacterized protein n=2 Tax=Oryza sativa subsp. japonica TaxID=39947 RepID=Q6ZB89_ORYSJ|nr:hypothetical protein [Oryza sativa Japonica Group]
MATTLDTTRSDPKVGDDRSGAGVGVGAQTEAAPDGSYAWTAVIGGGGGGGGGDDKWWGRPKTVVVGRSWLRSEAVATMGTKGSALGAAGSRARSNSPPRCRQPGENLVLILLEASKNNDMGVHRRLFSQETLPKPLSDRLCVLFLD